MGQRFWRRRKKRRDNPLEETTHLSTPLKESHEIEDSITQPSREIQTELNEGQGYLNKPSRRIQTEHQAEHEVVTESREIISEGNK